MPKLFAIRPVADDQFSRFQRRILLLTLTMSSSLGMVASTIYVPSIPAIAAAFETPISRVQLTFVAYLLAFAASMLVLGPLSDRYGRRRTIIYGLLLSALSSIACAASPTIEFLIAARVVQGIGACAGLVVGRAITRELWGREAAAQVIAGRAIAATLMQAFAPVLGGYLQDWVGWRANFAVVAILAVVAMLLVFRVVPGDRAADSPRLPVRGMLANYQTLIGAPRFLSYAFTAAGSHAGFHIFAAGAPAVLIVGLGIRPEDYGYYASLPPLGFLLGSFLSNRLTLRLGINGLITIGNAVLVPAGLSMVMLALLGIPSPYTVIGPMILVCCASGLITPNATAGSLGVNTGIVGTASGFGSFVQMTGAAGATAALSLGPSGSRLALAGIIALAGLFAAISFASLIQFDQRPRRAAASAAV
jgi:DHA1 family bicyclomycin/chloramphenicol resistance-like MFS transporter